MSGAVQDGLNKSLLQRGYHISLDWELFHLEIERNQQVLTNNSFPLKLINSTIANFLNVKFKSSEESPKI